MNRAIKIAAGSMLAFTLIGSGGVSAASIGKDSLKGGNHQSIFNYRHHGGRYRSIRQRERR